MGSEIVIYQSEDGITKIETRLDDNTVWLTIDQMSVLFQKGRSTINEHILNVFSEGELVESESLRKIGNTDFSTKPTNYYNLDVIISVGYRVKSPAGTQFRRWATERLREYLVKGFTMNDEMLKEAGGGKYWKELLARIKDIRSSEKVLYRQVLDLYATSVDYDPKSLHSVRFFKTVQNKLHYAAHGQTAAEIISERANAGKPFMGLLSFSGSRPSRSEVVVAKNYLSEEELKRLNNIVSTFFDIAEDKAIDHKPMHMNDWLEELDRLVKFLEKPALMGAGKISHREAVEKAQKEYAEYSKKTVGELSPVEQAYIENLKEAQKKIGAKK